MNGYLAIWFTGFICVIIKTIIDHRQVVRFLRNLSFSVPAKVSESAEMIRTKMGIKKRPCLRIATPSQVPFCYGVLNPVVVLPATEDPEQQTYYIKHEFAHIARYDLLWMFLGRMACALCWFNPLIWFALDQVRRESEYVADDLVLAYGTEPAFYACNILALVQNCKMERRPLTLAMAQAKGLSSRIECIMDPSVRRQLPSNSFLLTLFLGTVLLVFSVICVRPVAAESLDSLSAAPIKPPFPSGVVAIHVVDVRKRPLAGVLITPVNIFSLNGSTCWVNPEDGSNKPTHDILTNASGQANIPYVLDDAYQRPASDPNGVPVSEITVEVSSPNCARTRAILSVSATNPDIVLEPGVAVTFEALGEDGMPLPRVSVLVDGNDQTLWGDKWHSSPDSTSITSDPLLPGNYTFRIFTRGSGGSLSFSDLVSVTLGKGQTNAEYQFPVKPARTVIGVLDASVARPVRHGFVTVFVSPRPQKEDGQPYEEPNWTTHAEIADNGTFVLKNLPDGIINLTSFCDGYISKPSNDFDYLGVLPQVFRNSEEQPIVVKMDPTGTLRVHLVSSGGVPVQGMKVRAELTEWLNYGTNSQMGATSDSLDQSLFMQGISTPDSRGYDYSAGFTQKADANGDVIIRNLPLGDKQAFSVQNAKGAFLGGAVAAVTNPESTVIFDVDTKKVLTLPSDPLIPTPLPPIPQVKEPDASAAPGGKGAVTIRADSITQKVNAEGSITISAQGDPVLITSSPKNAAAPAATGNPPNTPEPTTPPPPPSTAAPSATPPKTVAPDGVTSGNFPGKLMTTHLLKIDFKNTSVLNAINDLNSQVKLLNPDQTPNLIILKGKPAHDILNIQLSDVSLKNILDIMCAQTGMHYQIEGQSIVLSSTKAENESNLVVQTFSVPPNFFGDSIPTAGEPLTPNVPHVVEKDVTNWFKGKGVLFPDGTGAAYLQEANKIVVRNTAANLASLQKIISAEKPLPPAK